MPEAGVMPESLTLRQELMRKAIHVQSVAVPAGYALGVPRSLLVAMVAVLVVTALVIEAGRRRSPWLRERFARTFAPLLREHEHSGLAGATWLLVAFLLAVMLLPRSAAIAAMWAVSVGDATAALVGRWIGRRRLTSGSKTLEGSAACALASGAGAWLVAGLPAGASLVAGSLAALAEWPSRPLDDNMRIALVVGGGIFLWQLAFP